MVTSTLVPSGISGRGVPGSASGSWRMLGRYTSGSKIPLKRTWPSRSTVVCSRRIVPWPVGERPIVPQVEAALPWLGKLLELLPKLRVVALLGNDARRATQVLYLCRPDLHVLHGPHPRLWGNKPQNRAWLEATVSKARYLIRDNEDPSFHYSGEECHDFQAANTRAPNARPAPA